MASKLLAFASGLVATACGAPTSIFVSTTGSDSTGNGSQANPFATVPRAQQAVRALNENMQDDIFVYLRSGLYYVPSTIQFTPADSGSNGHYVRYVSFPGDAPNVATLHGGVPVTGWKQVNASTNLWSAVMPVPTRQMYVNGDRANRTYHAGCLAGSVTATSWGYTTSDTAPLAWLADPTQNVADIEFLYTGVGSSWTECRCRVAGVSPLPGGGSNVTMAQPCWSDGLNRPYGQSIGSNCGNIENIAALMETPGQYYYNSATGVVSYLARPGDNMPSASVVAASTEVIISLVGDRNAQPAPLPVSFLTFEGLTIAFGGWLAPSSGEGYVDMQSSFRVLPNTTSNDTTWPPVPAHVQVHTGWNISFVGLTFTHLGMTALSAGDGSQSILVANSTFTDVSCGGVLFGQVDDLETIDPTRQNAHAHIFNNLFDGIPVEYHDCAPIVGGFVVNMTIEHNSVLDSSNTGISIGWGWSREISPSLHDNRILSNYVHGSNWLLQDGGSIYTLGAQPNSEFAYNLCSDQVKLFGSIYHDEGSAYWHTHHNVVNNGPEWLHIWTSSIHDIVVDNCWTNQNYSDNHGTNITLTNITYLATGEPFPPDAVAIMTASGVLGSGPKPTPLPAPVPSREDATTLSRRKCRYCADAVPAESGAGVLPAPGVARDGLRDTSRRGA